MRHPRTLLHHNAVFGIKLEEYQHPVSKRQAFAVSIGDRDVFLTGSLRDACDTWVEWCQKYQDHHDNMVAARKALESKPPITPDGYGDW